jgi:hypothetical protein
MVASTMYEPNTKALTQVKEMIYRATAMRLVSLGSEDAGERPRWLNVRISSDSQTVAARQLRERISDRLHLALAPATVLLKRMEGKLLTRTERRSKARQLQLRRSQS